MQTLNPWKESPCAAAVVSPAAAEPAAVRTVAAQPVPCGSRGEAAATSLFLAGFSPSTSSLGATTSYGSLSDPVLDRSEWSDVTHRAGAVKMGGLGRELLRQGWQRTTPLEEVATEAHAAPIPISCCYLQSLDSHPSAQGSLGCRSVSTVSTYSRAGSLVLADGSLAWWYTEDTPEPVAATL